MRRWLVCAVILCGLTGMVSAETGYWSSQRVSINFSWFDRYFIPTDPGDICYPGIYCPTPVPPQTYWDPRNVTIYRIPLNPPIVPLSTQLALLYEGTNPQGYYLPNVGGYLDAYRPVYFMPGPGEVPRNFELIDKEQYIPPLYGGGSVTWGRPTASGTFTYTIEYLGSNFFAKDIQRYIAWGDPADPCCIEGEDGYHYVFGFEYECYLIKISYNGGSMRQWLIVPHDSFPVAYDLKPFIMDCDPAHYSLRTYCVQPISYNNPDGSPGDYYEYELWRLRGNDYPTYFYGVSGPQCTFYQYQAYPTP